MKRGMGTPIVVLLCVLAVISGLQMGMIYILSAPDDHQTSQPVHESRSVVVIGDSFSDTRYHTTWVSFLQDKQKNNWTVQNFARGGAGFVTHSYGSAGVNFNDELTIAAHSPRVDRDKTTDVLIYGGFNDWNHEVPASVLIQAIEKQYRRTQKLFPRADVSLVLANAGLYSGSQRYTTLQWNEYWNEVFTNLDDKNIQYINAMNWLLGYGDEARYEDLLHPNALGAKVISQRMESVLNYTYSPSVKRSDQFAFDSTLVSSTIDEKSRRVKLTFTIPAFDSNALIEDESSLILHTKLAQFGYGMNHQFEEATVETTPHDVSTSHRAYWNAMTGDLIIEKDSVIQTPRSVPMKIVVSYVL